MSTITLARKNVLIAGGAGFIGSHLAERIARDGPESLVVVDDLSLGRRGNLRTAQLSFPDLRLNVQDVSDLDAMGKLLADTATDVVFNLAVLPLPASLVRPKHVVDVNVAIATTLCELQRQGLFHTLVHVSSSEAYGSAQYAPMDERHPLDPHTPYAASKVAADAVALSYHRTFGCDLVVLRPFNNYGPRQNDGEFAGLIPTVLSRALSGRAIEIDGDGEQTRDFVFVEDVVDAVVRAYGEPKSRGLVLNVASGIETSVNYIVAELVRLLGVSVPVHHGAARPGDIRTHVGDTRRAREIIGWSPRTSLGDGLAITVDWYARHAAKR